MRYGDLFPIAIMYSDWMVTSNVLPMAKFC